MLQFLLESRHNEFDIYPSILKHSFSAKLLFADLVWVYFTINFSEKKSFKNIIRVSGGLDPVCLQRLSSADDTSMQSTTQRHFTMQATRDDLGNELVELIRNCHGFSSKRHLVDCHV